MGDAREDTKRKPIRWVGRSRDDLRRFPDGVKRDIGFALDFAQRGTKHPSAKPLKGFGGAGVWRWSNLIRQRLKLAEADYKRWKKEQSNESTARNKENE